MTLKASPNEHNGKLLRVRDRIPDMVITKKPLPGGDYSFEAHGKVVAIEVKWSTSDLLDSLKSTGGENSGPRLAVELRKMLGYADIPWLITAPLRSRGDGLIMRDDGEPTGWRYTSVKGILADCALYGCVIEEWDGDISERIAQLYYTISKKEHGWIQQRGRPNFISLDPLLPQVVWALAAFDGVGADRAQAIVEKGWSVMDVGSKSLKELQQVEGIGPKTAKSLLEGLNRRW